MLEGMKKTELLFPNQTEGYYNISALEKKIKKFLPKEDHDWAKEFCMSIMNLEDYVTVKKELKRLSLTDLRKNHHVIQNIIDNPKYTDDILVAIKHISNIIAQTNKICSAIVGVTYSEFSIKNKREELEYTLDMTGYLLFQEEDINDSILVQIAIDKYNKSIEWAKEIPYLEEFTEFQRQQIPKDILRRYREDIKKYKREKHYVDTETIRSYVSDACIAYHHNESKKAKMKNYNY